MLNQLVGRAPELGVVRELRRFVTEGRTRLLLITGPPGIGKSALAAEGVEGLAVVHFHHREVDRDTPMGAVRGMVRENAPDVGELADSLAQREVALTIAGLLEGLEPPRAIVVEDIHWMDGASQEVVWHIIERLEDIGCLVVFTSRESSDWLTERLAHHIAFTGRGEHIRLGPLGRDAVAEYVRDRLNVVPTAAQVASIMDACGGSPLYLEALVTQLERSRVGADSLARAIRALTRDSAAEPLAEAVSPETLGLSQPARVSLLAIALGGPLTIEQLRRACHSLGVDRVPTAEIAATGLLPTDRLVFRHHRLAESFVDHFGLDQVRATRRALARVVGGLEALRHRVAAVGDGTDQTLLPELLQHMAAAAESRDLDTAHLLASWAADVDPTLVPTACLFAFRTRRPGQLLSHEEQIRGMLPGPYRQVLLGALEAGLTGREPPELADPALLAQADDTTLLLLAHAYAELGRRYAAAAAFAMPPMLQLVEEQIERRVAGAAPGDDPEVVVGEFQSLAALLRLWWVFGVTRDDPRHTIREFRHMAEQLRGTPAAAPVALRATQIAASLASYLASNADASRWLDELTARDPTAAHDLSVTAIGFRLHFLGGLWDEAQLLNEPALAYALEALRAVDTLRAQAMSALVPLCRGETEYGQEILRRVEQAERSSGFSAATGTIKWATGWVGAVTGDHAAVLASLNPLWMSPATAIFAGVSSGLLRVRAFVAGHDLVAARAALSSLLDLQVEEPARSYFRQHAEGVIAHGQGHHRDADAHLRKAAAVLDALIADTPLGWRLLRSLLAEDHQRLLLGTPSLRRPGDEVPFEDAITLARQLGAKPWRVRLEKLRSSDLTPRRGSAGSPDHFDALGVLTSREREIALLVLAGASNRDIATKLFVSVRTVEYHVRNTLQKLGVGSRVELRELLRPVASGKGYAP